MTVYFIQSIQPLMTTYYKDNQLVGCITARQLTITLYQQSKFPCYYIDFMCV